MGSLANLRSTTRAALCLECGKCSTMCPLAPWGGFSAARTMSIQDPETQLQGQAEAVQRCLTCGSCEVRCPQGVRYTEFVRGLRAEIPKSSRLSCPHGEVLQAAARLAAGSSAEAPAVTWLDDGLQVAAEGEVALFVGCLPLFDAIFARELGMEMVEIARAAVRLLNRLGIEPVVVPEERCCGHDLLWRGERDGFEGLARANAEAFKRRGVKHIVTACAECCRTWRLDYPEVASGYRPRVSHLSELLADRLQTDELTFRRNGSETVTFQDPCRLGRQLGVYEAPRRVLDAVPPAKVVEMELAGADAQCCGTPGFIYCDAVCRQLQSQRLESAAATGAARLLTACPKCLIHFRCAQSEDRRRGRGSEEIQIEDLTVFVAGMLGEESAARPSGHPPERGEAS